MSGDTEAGDAIPATLDIVVCPVCGLRSYWLREGMAHEVPGSRRKLTSGRITPGAPCPGAAVLVRYVRQETER